MFKQNFFDNDNGSITIRMEPMFEFVKVECESVESMVTDNKNLSLHEIFYEDETTAYRFILDIDVKGNKILDIAAVIDAVKNIFGMCMNK